MAINCHESCLLAFLLIFVVVTAGDVPSPPVFTSTSTMGDFPKAITKVTVSLDMPGMPPNLAKMSDKQLRACLPEDPAEKLLISSVSGCFGPSLASIAECFLLKTPFLNNGTDEINMPNLKKAGYQGTTLTTEQKSAAAAAFESCINNSDFVLPSQLYDPSGRDGSYTRKYSNQNDPLRLYICFAKGALQNGCTDAKM